MGGTKVWPKTDFHQKLVQGDDDKKVEKPKAQENQYSAKSVVIGNHTTDAFTTQQVKVGSQNVGTDPKYVPTSIYPVVTATWPKTDFYQKLVQGDKVPAKASSEAPVEPKESPAAPAVGAKNPKVEGKKAEAPKVDSNQYSNKSVVIGNHTTDAFTTQDVKIGTQNVGTAPKYVPTSVYPVITKTWEKTGFVQKI